MSQQDKWKRAVQEKTILLSNGLEIAITQRIDNKNAINILALHGWLDNSASFLPLFESLQQVNLYAVDFPGHGKSSWREPQAHYYLIDYVEDVARIIEALNLSGPVILLGHSMGAMVANLFAATFPAKIDGLILIEGVGFVTTPESDVTTQLAKAIRHRLEKRVYREKYYDNLQQLIDARVKISDLSADHAKIILQRNSLSNEQGVKLTIDPKLKHHSGFRFCPSQAHQICQQIRHKVLLILGKQGPASMHKEFLNYRDDFGELTTEYVEGGHHCHMESPQEVAKLVDLYVKGCVEI